jgi:hypothetical protein
MFTCQQRVFYTASGHKGMDAYELHPRAATIDCVHILIEMPDE